MSRPAHRPPAAQPPAPTRPSRGPRPLRLRLHRVRVFLCDVDGVLTDGSVYLGARFEAKRFDIRDGLGLRLLQRQGLKVGWVSHRVSPATSRRAKDLGVDFLHQGPENKAEVIQSFLDRLGRRWDELCYVGDDLVDLGVMRRAGLAVSVPGGAAEAQACAHYVTRAPGGSGAIREIVELILKAQGKWDELLSEYQV